jgi:2-methylcitrate dehydratase PrpD
MQATQRLAALGRRVSSSELPADVLEVAKHCVLDFIGVTLAGTREPLARIVDEQLCRADAGDECALLGRGRRTSVSTAALFHGTAAHALDYDDTHWSLQGHPTAPVLGALWGLAERERASGAALLAAFVAGVEVECRLGQWLNPDHYLRGFHATGTLGAFGAAAGAAHLLGASERAWLHAFGLAGTQAAGLKSAFGTMAKPFHAGRAAQTGLTAALLAAGGFEANPAILEAEQGFGATHGVLAARAEAPERFLILDTLFKYHAACHLTHATIDGIHALRAAQPLAAEAVERIVLTVDPTCLGVCAIENPGSGMQAKFSLKATAAMALLGDATADPRAFDDARVTSPELAQVMEKVIVKTEPMPATATRVELGLRDGQILRTAQDAGIPERDLARQAARIRAKFERLAPLPDAARSEVIARVANLEREPNLSGLLTLLGRATVGR